MAYSSSGQAKYRLPTVKVKSAQFDVKKKGKCYVRVSTHKDNQLKTSVAEYPLDAESEEEESVVYDTDTEYKSDSGNENYLSSCWSYRVSESLKIWGCDSDKISKGELDVEIHQWLVILTGNDLA
ncbi:hypothetical protein HAX54_044331 [Datura stramonium]|uniref:Uncharacterized protein n=1 Tax=Datura stramonium TaxID=4076 RepID=A0ABS8SPQ1_DATST|nr:hypothetical protein [Datura stramonium]